MAPSRWTSPASRACWRPCAAWPSRWGGCSIEGEESCQQGKAVRHGRSALWFSFPLQLFFLSGRSTGGGLVVELGARARQAAQDLGHDHLIGLEAQQGRPEEEARLA